MPAAHREGIDARDAARLETELARTPALRGRITAPVHSLRNLVGDWERFVRLMRSEWQPGGHYPISAYPEVLESRDLLDEALDQLPDEARRHVGALVRQLDEVFDTCTEPDPDGRLRPWVRPPADRPGTGRWSRRPRVTPW